MSREQLDALAAEIRTFLITSVSRTGGHLGPNLGVVELTLALHRVFDSPRDTILWDTGHQAYVHKILTGRQGDFPTLKQRGGLSGYPSRAESPHDVVENSHASTALSWADGLAKARQLSGEVVDRAVVAVIGDGALTGGMAWEALNNIAASRPPARHRGQRQRALLRADDRRPRPPPRDPAHDAGLRAVPRLGQAPAGSHAGRRRPDLRDAARHEEGPQGHRRAAGHVRGPRAEVHRADRRARRRGGRARPAPGPRVRRAGHRARDHAQGPRACARPRTTRPTTSTASASSTPRRVRRWPPPARRGRTSSPTRW